MYRIVNISILSFQSLITIYNFVTNTCISIYTNYPLIKTSASFFFKLTLFLTKIAVASAAIGVLTALGFVIVSLDNMVIFKKIFTIYWMSLSAPMPNSLEFVDYWFYQLITSDNKVSLTGFQKILFVFLLEGIINFNALFESECIKDPIYVQKLHMIVNYYTDPINNSMECLYPNRHPSCDEKTQCVHMDKRMTLFVQVGKTISSYEVWKHMIFMLDAAKEECLFADYMKTVQLKNANPNSVLVPYEYDINKVCVKQSDESKTNWNPQTAGLNQMSELVICNYAAIGFTYSFAVLAFLGATYKLANASSLPL